MGDAAAGRAHRSRRHAQPRLPRGEAQCTAREWEALAGYYRAELRRIDGAVGRLLAATRAALDDRPTYIVLLSDHGEGLDPVAGATHHGGALRRDLLAVPLLVSGPGVEPAAIATPVSLVDVAPTLVALAGAEGASFDGRSLAPLLSGGMGGRLASLALAGRTLQAEEHYYWWRGGRRRAARDVASRAISVGVLHGDWWYTRAPHRELAERLPIASSGRTAAPPLPVLRRAAKPLLRAAAVETEPHAESAELEATLTALGYAGGGGGGEP